MAGGSAPARNYRGLLGVHLPFGLRTCTLVAPRTSPEAPVGDLSPQLLQWLPGRIDNSPDGTCTRWPSRPRRSLPYPLSTLTSFRAALPPASSRDKGQPGDRGLLYYYLYGLGSRRGAGPETADDEGDVMENDRHSWILAVRERLASPPPRRLPASDARPALVLVPLY